VSIAETQVRFSQSAKASQGKPGVGRSRAPEANIRRRLLIGKTHHHEIAPEALRKQSTFARQTILFVA